MSDPQDGKELDAATRERLGRLTLALAEDIFDSRDAHLATLMRVLMKEVGRVITRNLDDPQNEYWTQ